MRETGLCYPDIELVGRLGEFFSVSVNELLVGERLAELTRETADAITKESVQTYGKEIQKRVSRKALFVSAGILLVCVLLCSAAAVLLTDPPPSGIEKVYAEYCKMYDSETADIGQLLVQYDLNGERRTAAVSVLVEKDINGLHTVNILRQQMMEDGRWPMDMTAFCYLKTEGRFRIVLTIFAQKREKDHRTTVTELCDVVYDNGNYTIEKSKR